MYNVMWYKKVRQRNRTVTFKRASLAGANKYSEGKNYLEEESTEEIWMERARCMYKTKIKQDLYGILEPLEMPSIEIEDYDRKEARILADYRIMAKDDPGLSEEERERMMRMDPQIDSIMEETIDSNGYDVRKIGFANLTEEEEKEIQQVVQMEKDKTESIQIYTDGSYKHEIIGQAMTGAAVVIRKGDETIKQIGLKVPGTKTIMKAEQHAIRVALLIVQKIHDERVKEDNTEGRYDNTTYTINTDSKTNMDRETVNTDWHNISNTNLSQTQMDINQKYKKLRGDGINVELVKVKAHTTVEGNNQADEKAKQSLTLEHRPEIPTLAISITYQGRLVEQKINKQMKQVTQEQALKKQMQKKHAGAIIRQLEQEYRGGWRITQTCEGKNNRRNAANHRAAKAQKTILKLITQSISYREIKECVMCGQEVKENLIEKHIIDECDAMSYIRETQWNMWRIQEEIEKRIKEYPEKDINSWIRIPELNNIPYTKKIKLVQSYIRYNGQTADKEEFREAIGAMNARYKTLGRHTESDQQWAIPHTFMNMLKRVYGIEVEGCSSPINRTIDPEIKSIMVDPGDIELGADHIDIFKYSLPNKVVQINPPYLEFFIKRVVCKILMEMALNPEPIRVVMVIPVGGDKWVKLRKYIVDTGGKIQVEFDEGSFPFTSERMEEINQDRNLHNNINRAKFQVGVVVYQNYIARVQKKLPRNTEIIIKQWARYANIEDRQYRINIPNELLNQEDSIGEKYQPQDTWVKRLVTNLSKRKTTYKESGMAKMIVAQNQAYLMQLAKKSQEPAQNPENKQKRDNKNTEEKELKEEKTLNQKTLLDFFRGGTNKKEKRVRNKSVDRGISNVSKAEKKGTLLKRTISNEQETQTEAEQKDEEWIQDQLRQIKQQYISGQRLLAESDLDKVIQPIIEQHFGMRPINIPRVYEITLPIHLNLRRDTLKNALINEDEQAVVIILLQRHYLTVHRENQVITIYDSLKAGTNPIARHAVERIKQIIDDERYTVRTESIHIQRDATNCGIYAPYIAVMKMNGKGDAEIKNKAEGIPITLIREEIFEEEKPYLLEEIRMRARKPATPLEVQEISKQQHEKEMDTRRTTKRARTQEQEKTAEREDKSRKQSKIHLEETRKGKKRKDVTQKEPRKKIRIMNTNQISTMNNRGKRKPSTQLEPLNNTVKKKKKG